MSRLPTIEANADSVMDNLADAANNASAPAAEYAMDIEATAVRNTGDAQAKDMRTVDLDTNLSNGL